MYSVTLDPDPNRAKILDQDPNSMYWIHNTGYKYRIAEDIKYTLS